MAFDFIRVENSSQVDAFHKFPFHIYRSFPSWMPPFRFEVENIFDPQKNELFNKGECERYLIYRGKTLVGRYALMNAPEQDRKLNPTMGGMGFIEMENDPQLAAAMIDFAAEWHKKRGYKAMRGPINFGKNDSFWGLLVENFEDPNTYGMMYHPPYYKELLEQTDAQKIDDQFSYKRSFSDPVPERLINITERIHRKKSITFRPIDKKNLYRDAEFIRQIYNKAWSSQDIVEREEEFTELTQETVQEMVKNLKPLLIPECTLLGFVNDEPASFSVSVPDLNEFSKKTGGKLKWWHIPQLFWFKKQATRLRTLAFGTVPEYRKMGLDALLFVQGVQGTHRVAPNLEYLEGGWISEKNWLMQRSVEALGCVHYKTHRTYRWEF